MRLKQSTLELWDNLRFYWSVRGQSRLSSQGSKGTSQAKVLRHAKGLCVEEVFSFLRYKNEGLKMRLKS